MKLHQNKQWLVFRAGSFVLPTAVLLVWETAARMGLLPKSHSAPPSVVVYHLAHLLYTSALPMHLLYSMGRLLGGLVFGTVLGVFSGVILGSCRTADKLFSPTVGFLAGLPVVVWMPFWIILLGSGEGFKIGLSLTATYFLVHVHTFQAVRVVGLRYIELAEMYEKSLYERIRHILLPSAIPSILTASRIAIAIGWIVIFFVEFAAAREGSEGLGWFIADARQVGRVEDELAGFLLLGVAGFLMDRAVSFLQRRVSMWSDAFESRFYMGDTK